MTYKVTLNNNVYEVEVKQGEAVVLNTYAAPVGVPAPTAIPVSAPVSSGGVGETVPSPLPGTIVAIKVSTGESVKKGQTLVIIEAMKMESSISSPHDGVIGEILVAPGTSVQSGTPLLKLQ